MPSTMVPKMQIVKILLQKDVRKKKHFKRELDRYSISKVIKETDDDESYDLDLPIFIVGYSKMRRGISFRSKKRVPTHMLVLYNIISATDSNLMNQIKKVEVHSTVKADVY